MLTSGLLGVCVFIQWADKNCHPLSLLPSAITHCGFFISFSGNGLQPWIVLLTCIRLMVMPHGVGSRDALVQPASSLWRLQPSISICWSIYNVISGYRNISWFPTLSRFPFGNHPSTPSINAIKTSAAGNLLWLCNIWTCNCLFSSTALDWYPDWYLLGLYGHLIAFSAIAQSSLVLANQKYYYSILDFWK